MRRAGRAAFSRESVRWTVQWLLIAAAALTALAPLFPHEAARGVCLQLAGGLALLALAGFLYYGVRFGHAFLGFLVRRLAVMSVTLIGITAITFLVVRLAPGDPVTSDRGESVMGVGGEDDIRRARHELLGSQVVHAYSARAVDPDGDQVRLEFDWGDESRSLSQTLPSDTDVTLPHVWWQAGDYEIRVRAIDEHDATSSWSPSLLVRARQGSGVPPAPPRPKGPEVVTVGESYPVEFVGSMEDTVILIDWGDEIRRQARQPGNGEATTRHHTWHRPGLFDLRARAVASSGALSAWSPPLLVAAFSGESPLAGPELWADRHHASPGEVLTFSARAVSRTTDAELIYRLHVREEPPSAPPVPAPPEVVVRKPSGDVVEFSHRFEHPGRYVIAVSVSEARDATTTKRSAPLGVTIDDGNRAPLTPGRPKGPLDARVETTLVEQYLRWLANVIRLDFGRSYANSRDTWQLIRERLPRTLILSALSMALAYLIAIPVGVYSATHRHSLVDRCIGVSLFTLYSLPSFWVATMLIVLAADYPRIPILDLQCGQPSLHPSGAEVHVPLLGLCFAVGAAALSSRLARRRGLGSAPATVLSIVIGASLAVVGVSYLPLTELTSGALLGGVLLCVALFVIAGSDSRGKETLLSAGVSSLAVLLILVFAARLMTFDLFWHALLPVACLTYGGLAALSRYTRSGLLDVMHQDYIRTARAKGLTERSVIFRHALRNGLIPVLTVFASVLPQLISGSVIIESIFTIEGMGLLLIKSINDRDYNVTMAVTTLTAIMTMLGLLLSDVLYVVVDPRINFEKQAAS